MTSVGEPAIYRDLLRFKPDGLSPNAWAIRAGVSRTVWADMRRHGNPSRRTLEKLLVAAGSSLAEFEALRLGAATRSSEVASNVVGDPMRSWRPAALPPLPLIESSLGGPWTEGGGEVELTLVREAMVLDRLQRPLSLASDAEAYALTVVGDSMWPRFRPGQRIAVSPRSPVTIGDDVLLKLKPDGGESEQVLINRLVRRDANGIELRQFNPDLTFKVGGDEVAAIHKIAGELI